MKKVLIEGDSDIKPQRGDICKINVIGKLENGTVVENQQEVIVHVGDNEVVQGIDMALPLMGLGETAEVICESRFGYGTIGLRNEQNASASVPPGAKVFLIFLWVTLCPDCLFRYVFFFRLFTPSNCYIVMKRVTLKIKHLKNVNRSGRWSIIV